MIAEIADRLHLSSVAAAKRLRAGTLPAGRVFRLWRVREADLTAYSNSLKPAQAKPNGGDRGA
jgi:hypothetical protein